MSKKPIQRLRRVKTKPRAAPPSDTPDDKDDAPKTLSSSERQELTAIHWVLHHPQYPNILASIRLGTTNADIANHFIERGYFDITRKTAMIYLAAFRRKCPDLCRPREGANGMHTNADGQQVALRDYDHLFDGNVAIMSLEVELTKLMMVQKQRISIDYSNERSLGKLFSTTSKEIQVLGELMERMHKIKNGTGSQGSSAQGLYSGNEDEIRDGLAAIRQDETDRLMTSDAIKMVVQGVVRG